MMTKIKKQVAKAALKILPKAPPKPPQEIIRIAARNLPGGDPTHNRSAQGKLNIITPPQKQETIGSPKYSYLGESLE